MQARRLFASTAAISFALAVSLTITLSEVPAASGESSSNATQVKPRWRIEITNVNDDSEVRCSPAAINERGQIVGTEWVVDATSNDSARHSAFLWLPEPACGLPAGVTRLCPGWGAGLNDRCEVIVRSRNPLTFEGALWRGGACESLPSLAEGENPNAIANSTSSWIGGTSESSTPWTREWPPTIWSWSGDEITMRALEICGEETRATVLGMNERGDAVGAMGEIHLIPWSRWRAVQWRAEDGGACSELAPFGSAGTVAEDINERGDVVGYAFSYDFPYYLRALLWLPEPRYGLDEGVHLIGPEGGRSSMYAINDRGIAVGEMPGGASVWIPGIGMRLLSDFMPPDSPWILGRALDINNSNEIVGWGHIQNAKRCFRARLVPADSD